MSEHGVLSATKCTEQSNVQSNPKKMHILDFSQSSWEAAIAYNEHGVGKELVDEINARVDRDYAALR